MSRSPAFAGAGVNSEGCNGPPSAASCLIAGARSAVIQSRPAGRSVCSIRALVSSPRSPTIATRCRWKRCFSLSICDDRVIGSAVLTFKYLDRYRAAVGRAHQADDNLRPVTTVVAAVAMLCQFAAAPFEISGGDIVEQQRAVLQVAAGQPGFDERLLAAQPVERGIDLLGGNAAEPQHLAQRMAGGGGIQHPRGRQLGRWLEQARDDQG